MSERTKGWVLWARDGYRGPKRQPQTNGLDDDDSLSDTMTSTVENTTAPDRTGSYRRGPANRPPRFVPRGGTYESLVDQIIEQRSVRILYQPVFDVIHQQVVGFEALARGPEGPLQLPAQLFAAARSVGRLGELDWVCRAAAFRGMLNAGLHPSVSLFVNVEPDSLMEPCPDQLLDTIQEAVGKLRVFIDVSGPAMSRYPCQILDSVRRARAANWGIAVNDIEYSPACLAMLPTIEPDVIKLNANLLATVPGDVSAATIAAMAERERGGATILVDRVENDDTSKLARALGSRFHQGRLLAGEDPLPQHIKTPAAPLPLLHAVTPDHWRTPWQILTAAGSDQTTNVSRSGLDYLTAAIATAAGSAEQPAVVAALSAVGSARPESTRAAYSRILDRCPLVVVIGPEVSIWNDWRVRAFDVPAGHHVRAESCFIALSPSMASMVAATPSAHPAGTEPTWDIVISQNHDLCRTVLRELLGTADALAGGVHFDSG